MSSSYEQFAGKATMVNFLPLLAERFAKQRLTAMAKVEGQGTDGKPIVLFLCVHNAGRSQMALGFFNHYAGDQAVAWSGGSEPAEEVNRAAVAAMAERGIDIAQEYPEPWTDEIVQAGAPGAAADLGPRRARPGRDVELQLDHRLVAPPKRPRPAAHPPPARGRAPGWSSGIALALSMDDSVQAGSRPSST